MDLLAHVDHAAVHQAGHDRRQLARHDREHRFIEPLQASEHVSALDERARLRVQSRCPEVGVPEALTYREGPACGSMRRLALARSQFLLGDEGDHVATLDAVDVLDGSLTSGQPGVALRGLTANDGCEREPERAAGCASRVIRLRIAAIQTFLDSLKLRGVTGQIGGRRQQLEIAGVERCRLICG